MTTLTLQPKLTATLADDDRGSRVYRLADERGYTHRYETIRVREYTGGSVRGIYEVHALRRDGWTPLIEGQRPKDQPLPYGDAIRRAVAVLFGMEDHG